MLSLESAAPTCLARRDGERVRHLLSREDGVVAVDQPYPDLVLPWRQIGYVDGVVITGISPPPGQVVDGDVQMPDPGETWRASGPNTCTMRRFSTRY